MFTVDWSEVATMELATQTMKASVELRHKIWAALKDIESQLVRSPDTIGESRPRGTRIAFFGPIVLSFSVNTRLEKVFVLKVRIPYPRR